MMRLLLTALILSALFSPGALRAQIDVSVDILTGKPQVSLPIASLSNGRISTDVFLVYNGGGYRVGDTEGNAGMSWNLAAHGYLAREGFA